ncbi:MAG: hypothetical protein O6940_02635, partial [Ignavibacteria bacterium]|nr:hypothetical protein [Ignavibacteria bacterium]
MYKRFLNLIIIAFTATLMVISGCFEIPNEIIFPEWNVDLNIPIAHKRFTIDELIRDQGFLATGNLNIEDSIYILGTEIYDLNADISDFIQLDGFETLTNIPVFTDSQSLTFYFEFPEGAVLDSAEFLSGTMDISVNNPTNNEVTFNLLVPGITDQGGNPLLIEIITPPQNVNSLSTDLKGFRYKVPANQPPEFLNSLMVITSATNENGAGNIVFFDFSTSEFSFSYVSGVMPATSLGIHENSFAFATELSDYKDKTILREAEMIVDAGFITQFSDPYPVDVNNLNIVGLRSDGIQFFLKDSTGNQNMFIHIEDGIFRQTFHESNSNITQFISFLPDTIFLIAEYILNPDVKRGAAAIDDSISFSSTITINSFLALKKSTVVDSGTIDLSEDEKDAIRDGNSVSITIELENAIPLAGWIRMDVVDEDHNNLFTITHNSNDTDTLFFNAAEVNENGEVTKPITTSPIAIELNSSQIEMMTRARFAVYSVTLRTSDAFQNPPKIVAIRPNAWLKLRSYGRINY